MMDLHKRTFSPKLNLRPSRKLLLAFNELDHPLSLKFLCFKCFGIIINPAICKNCQVGYCFSCLNKINKSNIFCFCKVPSYYNFSKSSIDNLQDTKYTFQIQYSNRQPLTNIGKYKTEKIESYNNALEKISELVPNCGPDIKSYSLYPNLKEYINQQNNEKMKIALDHQNNFGHKLLNSKLSKFLSFARNSTVILHLKILFKEDLKILEQLYIRRI